MPSDKWNEMFTKVEISNKISTLWTVGQQTTIEFLFPT